MNKNNSDAYSFTWSFYIEISSTSDHVVFVPHAHVEFLPKISSTSVHVVSILVVTSQDFLDILVMGEHALLYSRIERYLYLFRQTPMDYEAHPYIVEIAIGIPN